MQSIKDVLRLLFCIPLGVGVGAFGILVCAAAALSTADHFGGDAAAIALFVGPVLAGVFSINMTVNTAPYWNRMMGWISAGISMTIEIYCVRHRVFSNSMEGSVSSAIIGSLYAAGLVFGACLWPALHKSRHILTAEQRNEIAGLILEDFKRNFPGDIYHIKGASKPPSRDIQPSLP